MKTGFCHKLMSFIMKKETLDYFLFLIVFPFFLLFMVYYGFESSYTFYKRSEGTPGFLFTSVYGYRVIPNYMVYYMTLGMDFLLTSCPEPIKGLLLKNGTAFYHALFVMNSFFFIGCSMLINKILKNNTVLGINGIANRRLIHLVIIFFIVISQYAPSNCDMIALFCFLIGMSLTYSFFNTSKKIYYYSLILLIFVSSFVRETACLNIAFFASILIDFSNLKKNYLKHISQLMPLVMVFLIAYFALRIIVPVEKTTFVEGLYLVQNFTSPFNIIGFLFALVAFYFIYTICEISDNKRIFLRFLFFSLPYLMMITLVGLFWETRLFLPLIVATIIIIYEKKLPHNLSKN